ncbi:hypothetical protein BDN72DRAFT_903234 [Pluteus cervinus]|uniref:Uncharacterized protein n=1 Tax=Pluteus cervinus TaxID=181527 RepID=A0ACD3A9P4_9AGAR|nr:hypothetical protein BDN72DRAFT_903234 [Pluteus cervinus]
MTVHPSSLYLLLNGVLRNDMRLSEFSPVKNLWLLQAFTFHVTVKFTYQVERGSLKPAAVSRGTNLRLAIRNDLDGGLGNAGSTQEYVDQLRVLRQTLDGSGDPSANYSFVFKRQALHYFIVNHSTDFRSAIHSKGASYRKASFLPGDSTHSIKTSWSLISVLSGPSFNPHQNCGSDPYPSLRTSIREIKRWLTANSTGSDRSIECWTGRRPMGIPFLDAINPVPSCIAVPLRKPSQSQT